jgi:hypothetical protein
MSLKTILLIVDAFLILAIIAALSLLIIKVF